MTRDSAGAVPPLAAALADRYRFERELGGGGMSRVFVAEELALRRLVVVKIVADHLADLSTERFAREVQTVARLQQANIVPLLSAGEEIGTAYYTMPFVDGKTLRARMTRGGLPVGEALEVLRDIARALAYAHEQGIVHRDMKPENVLLSSGTAVVTDFGIAKALSDAREPRPPGSAPADATLTGAGGSPGTPAYMAPEQALGDSVDARADIYAWGVIAYEVLAGVHPFATQRTVQGLLGAHVNEMPAPLLIVNPGVPRDVNTIVMQCLAKDPAQRPVNGLDLMERIRGASIEVKPPVKRSTYVMVAVAMAVVVGLIALMGCASDAGAQPGNPARPNVVLIITDDVGYGDIGSYGAPDVRTPSIDRLAREGVRLTDFYSNGPTCTPTRVGLISGRYQQRFGFEEPLGAGGAADEERGLMPTGRSLPQLLKANGYATALVGKWHLGWKPEFSPNAHGFEYFFGYKNGFTDYYRHTDGAGRPDLFENERAVDVPGYMTDLITDRSIRFIEQHAAQPFFIDISYSAAHWPYQVPDMPSTARDNGRHLGPMDSATSTRAEYVAILERADQGVGRIMRIVDSLGLRQNTIVIFTNDNGGEWLSRNAPLFHHKASAWEGGIRVPAIVRWPGHIPAGRVSRQVGITMDFTASILAATHTPVPDSAMLDGIDLFPVLEGRVPEVDRTLFWRVVGVRPQRAVRSGDWKLIFDGPRPMLFNLRSDIGERTNLIGARPDVAQRLRPLLAAWQSNVDAKR